MKKKKVDKVCNGGYCNYKGMDGMCLYRGYCDYQCPRDSRKEKSRKKEESNDEKT